MSLTSGSKLGPYEIGFPIGAGGMGEVFRARDTKLSRDVAIKVLPTAFTHDSERVARFRREAQVVAALNHPNIAAIFGLEESNGVMALVLELVEGEDLAERLTRGAVPVEEAIAIAQQIAEGLESAHEKGIVHRDLKPANVKLTRDGMVKILDFGLARAYEGNATSNSDLANSPTMARPMTDAGIILGTAAYMSPEQARGKPVDKRADIWSFGVLLHELLTGRRLFRGETVSDTLAAVLREEVDWSDLPATTPSSVRRVLERCLDRDPKKRLRDIGEARVMLSESSSPPGAIAPDSSTRWSPRNVLAWTAATVLICVASALLAIWAWGRAHPPAGPVTRLTIPLPPGQVLSGNSGPAISRDGRTLAYVARDADGVARLYVRTLDRYEIVVVPQSETAQDPFFSPDGSKVGFFARGKLMTVSVSGGTPTPIADASYQPFGATWGEDGTIVYVPTLMSGLVRIPAGGGKPEALTVPDGAAKGYAHVFPQFLDKRRVLFTIWGGQVIAVGVLSLDSKAWMREPVLNRTSFTYAASGHLLGSGERGVTAIPFDPKHPRVEGEQNLVLDDVFSRLLFRSWFATSANGTLVYVPGDPSLGVMAWVDRKGVVSPITGKTESFVDPVLSADGKRVVVGRDATLWVLEMQRGALTRLTLDGEGINQIPVLTADGMHVVFASNRSGDWDLYSVAVTGGPATRILARPGIQLPQSMAPDGTLLFAERQRGTGSDFFLRAPDGTVKPFIVSPFSKVGGQFSPDGRTVAYASDETGREEVYLRSVARPEEVVVVSADGGRAPCWSPDGKELFYRRGESFFVVSAAIDGSLSVGDPQKLFDLRAATGRSSQNPGYCVSPDGKRLLVVIPDPRAIPVQINVVLNWLQELESKVPPR